MTIVLLSSATGAPGVTTSALALALTWPRSVLLVDCDPDPSQAVLAGWLGAAPTTSRGLVDLAQAHRQMAPVAPLVWQCAVPLTEPDESMERAGRPEAASEQDAITPPDGSPGAQPSVGRAQAPIGSAPGSSRAAARGALERRFLPGFTRPGAAAVFEPVWAELAPAFAGLAGGDVDVLVDLGRLGARGPAAQLLEVGDVMAVVVRSSLRSLAATRLYLPMVRDRLSVQAGPRFGFVVVGPGRPYTDSEIERELAVPVLADLPWSPEEADVLIEGSPAPRRFTERPLMRGARAAATALAAIAPHPAESPRVSTQDSDQLSGALR